jgi:hypothetical protein
MSARQKIALWTLLSLAAVVIPFGLMLRDYGHFLR